MREQADSLTASRERLLIAYNQEQAMVTDLEQQLQRMREESAAVKRANKVCIVHCTYTIMMIVILSMKGIEGQSFES